MSQSGERSITTLSSYDEASTPRSSRGRMPEVYLEMEERPVEGPRGPHLFRSSTASTLADEHVLTLSPITPSTAKAAPYVGPNPGSDAAPELAAILAQANRPVRFTDEHLDAGRLAEWSPVMVAQSMLNAGVEFEAAERFIDNDIGGVILPTLRFEDLKELGLQSFGVRIRIWNQIQVLTDCKATSPVPPTPIEDVPIAEPPKPAPRRQESRRRFKSTETTLDDVISPMESVSIVGIEQVIPKPHHCAKGEACSKFRKQRRLIEAFKKEHPLASLDEAVLIAGDPGNPATAPRLDASEFQEYRPVSDAVPSVVASSDVLGPGGLPPLQYLREAQLQNLHKRDPQENVKQFLDFQRSQSAGSEVPPTPPFEILPQTQAPHHGLRNLPKLSIPKPSPSAPPAMPPTVHSIRPPAQHQRSRSAAGFIPYTMDKASPIAQDLVSPTEQLRRGTPFSEMDVPCTSVPLDAIPRDTSQSVPPDMNYRMPARSMSRASKRPSFPVMPPVDENRAIPPIGRTSKTPSPTNRQLPLKAPPRGNYPWSPIERTKPFETAIPPLPSVSKATPVKQAARSSTDSLPITTTTTTTTTSSSSNGASYEGPMKKRKTHFLRHEWQDGYFTLKGSRLNMHKDQANVDRTLEYVDIDDYAIACSTFASQSKLSAALKTMHIRQGKSGKADVAAFAFQLVPQDKQTAKLRKRESALPGGAAEGEGVNGTGKTHHFAVRGREERIDWMRELMLAKALKQKGEGWEVSVNGNMI